MLAEYLQIDNNQNQDDEEEKEDILLYLEKNARSMKPSEEKL